MMQRRYFLEVFVRFLKTHNVLEKYKRKLDKTLVHDFEGLMWYDPSDWIAAMFSWGSEGCMWRDLYEKWNIILYKLKNY